MSSSSQAHFRNIKKLVSNISSRSDDSGPLELVCRFDGRIIKANESSRLLLNTLKLAKLNRFLPGDHFELINRALHSGDVVVAANNVNGCNFEWKYYLDKGSKAIRIESIQYAIDSSKDVENNSSAKASITERWSNFIDAIPVSVCVTQNNSDKVIVMNQMAMRMLNIVPGKEKNARLRNVFTDPQTIRK